MTSKDEVRHTVRVGAGDAGLRLDRFLADALPGLSRARIKTLVQAGRLGAGGETIADPSYRVKPGQELALSVPEAAPAAPRGQAIALDVVYEDADVIVVDKPAGLV
ncbi:MAG: S4 domain-containing protein, partial [Alphaproteobacteria bacterium]